MSDDQQKAERVVALICELFPDRNPKDVLAGPVAKAVLGELSGYSEREDYEISSTTSASAGSFIAAYAYDTDQRGEDGRKGVPVVVLIERGNSDRDGNALLGVPGGFMNLDFVEKDGVVDRSHGEQPKEGAVRELTEELLNDKGTPVISPDPSRLQLLVSGVSYKKTFGTACCYHGHALELTPEEFSAIKTHAAKLESDPAYAEAVTKASGGEVMGVLIKPLSEVMAMPKERFMHSHEYDALQTLDQELRSPSLQRSR